MPDYCPDCKGSGTDAAKTAKARRTGACDRHSYIRCWTCSGNGLDPRAFFRNSSKPITPNSQPNRTTKP